MIRAASRMTHALLSIALLATTALTQTAFTDQSYGTPNGRSDIFVADLNGIAKDDIVTVENSSNTVTVFLNHGDGTFTLKAPGKCSLRTIQISSSSPT